MAESLTLAESFTARLAMLRMAGEYRRPGTSRTARQRRHTAAQKRHEVQQANWTKDSFSRRA